MVDKACQTEDPEQVSGEEVDDAEALGEYAPNALACNAVRVPGEDDE